MFGPYLHQIDPILFDIVGVHLWGTGWALPSGSWRFISS